jgi:hypothetical protein
MGIMDKIAGRQKSAAAEVAVAQPGELKGSGNSPAKEAKHRTLTDEEREQLIAEKRSQLPELSKQVEDSVERLRDLSSS